MARFKVNDRARITDEAYPQFRGRECTILEVGKVECLNGSIRDYTVKVDGEKGKFGAIDAELEPIVDLGSWDELESTIKWNPTKEKAWAT